jgi:hypothetical protein
VIRSHGVAIMKDGRRLEFSAGPYELSRWERYALINGLPPHPTDTGGWAGLTMSYFLAFECDTAGQTERPPFDTWLQELGGIESFVAEEIPPIPPAASAEQSPSWPLEPESPPINSGPKSRGTSQPSLPS